MGQMKGFSINEYSDMGQNYNRFNCLQLLTRRLALFFSKGSLHGRFRCFNWEQAGNGQTRCYILRLKIVKGGLLPFGLCETPVGCKISKKLKEGPFGNIEKNRNNFKIEIFEQCHSAENCKRGDPLVESKKLQKKSHSPGKYPSEKQQKGGSYVIEVLDVDVFVLDEFLAFRVCFGRP